MKNITIKFSKDELIFLMMMLSVYTEKLEDNLPTAHKIMKKLKKEVENNGL